MAFLLDEDREILLDFVTESNEALEKTELVLLSLEEALAENSTIDVSKINTIFRTYHSIKGSAGFIGLVATNKLTHEAETLLDLIRKDKIKIKKEHIDIFLEVSDTLMMMMNHLHDNFTEDNFPVDTQELCDNITKFINETNQPGDRSTATAKQKKPAKSEKQAPEKEEIKTEKNNPSFENLITPEMEKQFVVDSTELLDSLEQDLLVLEKEPGNTALIENAFRSLHSLKGNAGFFNYIDINQICHKAETFLDKARTGLVVADAKQISLILQVLDFLRNAIDNLDAGKPPVIMGKIGLIDLMSESFGDDAADSNVSKEEEQQDIETAGEPEQDFVSDENDDENDTVKEKPEKVKEEISAPDNSGSHRSTSEVIRVDVNKLNKLMDLVGEIVISESMVSHNPDLQGIELESFEKSISYLQKNVRELQELATSMRMLPLTGVFGKMKRLVRDLSSKNQKKIELLIHGGDTEVDRSVLEHISDPLVHILRNAADHGIEKPEEREKKGKSQVGKIYLSAKQVGGEICITIKDDGAGLNRKKLINKAIEKGILSESETDLPDEKVWGLIFAPGFSTAAKVSDISGRGVGMDVVLRNVEKIRGKVEVFSEEEKGTTIDLRIPLTTAIVDGMILRVENAIYAIPTLDIKESLQVNEGRVVDLIDGQEVIKIRESMVPVIRLHELYQLSFEQKPLSEGIVVVTEKGGQGIGFLVDEILGQQQLVIKALPSYLGKIDGVSGCAILGDGAICMILDLANLVKRVEFVSK